MLIVSYPNINGRGCPNLPFLRLFVHNSYFLSHPWLKNVDLACAGEPLRLSLGWLTKYLHQRFIFLRNFIFITNVHSTFLFFIYPQFPPIFLQPGLAPPPSSWCWCGRSSVAGNLLEHGRERPGPGSQPYVLTLPRQQPRQLTAHQSDPRTRPANCQPSTQTVIQLC